MNLYDHKYMRFMLKDDRIDFVWKAQTEDMDDHGFQYAILRYASYVMEYNFKKVFVAPFMDNKVVGKEPGTDYDNAFMKSYDEAVQWLNT